MKTLQSANRYKVFFCHLSSLETVRSWILNVQTGESTRCERNRL